MLNALLFVPLGYLLVRAGLPLWAAVALSAGGSVVIETAQSFQPHRYATGGDILTNGLGALVGASVAKFGSRAARWLHAVGWSAGVVLAAPGALALIGTAWLYQTSLPVSAYYGQWTPDLGQFEPFPGEVTAAHVGIHPVPIGRYADSEQLRAELLRGGPIIVQVRPDGVAPSRPAPIFSIFDDQQREVLFLGARGVDGLARIRRRAAAVRLHSPFQVAPRLLSGSAPGEERVLRWTERDSRGCLEWDGRRTCVIREPISRGWAMVVPAQLGAAAWIGDGLWLALLFAPLAWAPRPRVAGFGAALLILTGAAVPPLTGVGSVPGAAWVLAGAVAAVSFLAVRHQRLGRELLINFSGS